MILQSKPLTAYFIMLKRNGVMGSLVCIAGCFLQILIVVSAQTTKNEGPVCLACQDVSLSSNCHSITRCASNEVCYTDSFNTTYGQVVHTMGCRDKMQCGRQLLPGKPPVCTNCCSGNLCNSGLCGLKGIGDQSTTTRGSICYACDQQLTPHTCTTIRHCGRHEVCFLKLDVHTDLYKTKCLETKECFAAVNSFTGRKRTHERFLNVINPCGIHCCNTDLCNDRCSQSSSHSVLIPTRSVQSTSTFESSPAITTPSTVTYTTPAATTSTQTTIVTTATTNSMNPCLPNPCQNDGLCSIYLSTYKCTCPDSMTGRNCEITHQDAQFGFRKGSSTADAIFLLKSLIDTVLNNKVTNHCSSNPCIHGTCISNLDGYVCICIPGYQGTHCKDAIDYCSLNPCVFGKCSNGINDFICLCDPGYQGNNCQSAVDYCASNPCVHGECSNGIGGYTCLCHTGYQGTNCQSGIGEMFTGIGECSSPCYHGQCKDGLCSCDLNYTGVHCQYATVHCTDRGDCERLLYDCEGGDSYCSGGVCMCSHWD